MSQFQLVNDAELDTVEGGIIPLLLVVGGVVTLYCAWKNAGN